jgi:hypothetical protein
MATKMRLSARCPSCNRATEFDLAGFDSVVAAALLQTALSSALPESVHYSGQKDCECGKVLLASIHVSACDFAGIDKANGKDR